LQPHFSDGAFRVAGPAPEGGLEGDEMEGFASSQFSKYVVFEQPEMALPELLHREQVVASQL
jgi:hypothetical protein